MSIQLFPKFSMFDSARIKLTLWYLLIIMSISILFSAILYQVLTKEINRFEQMHRFRMLAKLENGAILNPPNPQRLRMVISDPELIEETRQRILFSLFSLNGGILMISTAFGYLLAGRTLRPIQEMTDEQKRFISDASHEIKTPLTSLKTAFEVYLRTKHPSMKEAHTIMKESLSEIDKLQTLAESMLQLSNFEKPQLSKLNETVSIKEVVQASVKKTSYVALSKKISIKLSCTDFLIQGSKDQLIDLLVIVLDNAIKYSDPHKSVHISTHVTQNKGIIEIEDFGIGISHDDVKKIFERFYRSDKARNYSKNNGYGLGLAIAKKIVESHKGIISAQSKTGRGTTITIQLPLYK